jgi:hypothetical protein
MVGTTDGIKKERENSILSFSFFFLSFFLSGSMLVVEIGVLFRAQTFIGVK